MMSTLKTQVILLISIMLSACANLPPPDIATLGKTEHFWLSARLSIHIDRPSDAPQSATGQLDWWHDGPAQQDRIDILSPFGQTIAQLKGQPGDVRLTLANGRQFQASSLTELAQQGLGQPIPFERIPDWLEGKAKQYAEQTLDHAGRPLTLTDGTWSLRYGYPTETQQRTPETLFAQSTDGITLRLRIDRWRTGDAAPKWPNAWPNE